MFRDFPKKLGGRYWFQHLSQNSFFSNNQRVLILLDLCVVWCGSVKCSFSVGSVISLLSYLTVNNCIKNMLDFPNILHVLRGFLNQSDCRTFQTWILKKQAILNMHLDIIEGLDILGTNELIKCFCLVMVNSEMPPTLSWLIKFEDPWNSNNSRNVLVIKLFLAYIYIYIYIYIGVTCQCSSLLRLCQSMPELML